MNALFKYQNERLMLVYIKAYTGQVCLELFPSQHEIRTHDNYNLCPFTECMICYCSMLSKSMTYKL